MARETAKNKRVITTQGENQVAWCTSCNKSAPAVIRVTHEYWMCEACLRSELEILVSAQKAPNDET